MPNSRIEIEFVQLSNCSLSKNFVDDHSKIIKGIVEEKLKRNPSLMQLGRQLSKPAILQICISDIISLDFEVFDQTIGNIVNNQPNALRRISDSPKEELNKFIPTPLILITTWNIKQLSIELGSRIKYFDNSIWNRIVSLEPIEGISFEEQLNSVLNTVRYSFEMDLYNTFSGIEFIEYQSRKLHNSYLLKLAGGHSRKVKTDIFFSESESKIKANKKVKNLDGLKWGVLIIDDFSHKSLRVTESSTALSQTPNKIDLITNILQEGDYGVAYNKEESKIEVLNREDQPQEDQDFIYYGIECLKKYPGADIIFLDYYLGEDSSRRPVEGSDFILKIFDMKLGLLNLKPFDKHWIFPISVFDFAFRNALLELSDLEIIPNIAELNAHINIGRGADPVNNPELFRYLVFSMMEEQKKMIEFDLEDIFKILGIQLRETLETSISLSRKQYPQIARKTVNYFLYKELRESSLSVFANSFTDPGKKLVISFCVHLQHLLYMVAFESKTEWPRMWQEFQLIRNLFRQLKEEYPIYFNEHVRNYERAINHIKHHILELKAYFD